MSVRGVLHFIPSMSGDDCRRLRSRPWSRIRTAGVFVSISHLKDASNTVMEATDMRIPSSHRRVLHLIPNMGGGGAERQLTYIARGQVALGWDVHVAIVREGPNYPHLVSSGATIHRLRAGSNYDPRLLGQVLSLIRSLRPAIVHTRILQMDIIGGLASTLCRTPWVLSERASAPAYDSGFKNRLRIFLTRYAAAIDANSARGADYWSVVQPEVSVRIIPGGLPLEEIEAAPVHELRPPQRSPEVPAILFAGRFDAQKNVLNLLRALHLVMRQRDAVAVLCGRGPQEEEARCLVSELGIEDRVRFAGFVPDLWSLMKSADVFVSPAVFEGRPNSVLEAAACHCPLVVSDIAEHREFLDDSAALFVSWNDVDAIAAALIETLNNRAVAWRKAETAFQCVSRFTIPEMLRQLEALYSDVLAKTR